MYYTSSVELLPSIRTYYKIKTEMHICMNECIVSLAWFQKILLDIVYFYGTFPFELQMFSIVWLSNMIIKVYKNKLHLSWSIDKLQFIICQYVIRITSCCDWHTGLCEERQVIYTNRLLLLTNPVIITNVLSTMCTVANLFLCYESRIYDTYC